MKIDASIIKKDLSESAKQLALLTGALPGMLDIFDLLAGALYSLQMADRLGFRDRPSELQPQYKESLVKRLGRMCRNDLPTGGLWLAGLHFNSGRFCRRRMGARNMTSLRQKRIQVIGLTDVNCTKFDVPGAETEGCTTIQVTFVDRLTLKVHQITLEEVGGWTPEEFVAYLNRYLSPATNSPAITFDDINLDPRNCGFDTAWMPLPNQ